MNDVTMKSSVVGGGNSLNIINIISRNMFDKIIKSSDLNGCITPYDKNVWNLYLDRITCQDNRKYQYLIYYTPDERYNGWLDKSGLETVIGSAPFFQINYRE